MNSDEFNKRRQARIEHELAEGNTPQARAQAALDRWWSARRQAEAEERRMLRELDPCGLGIWDAP